MPAKPPIPVINETFGNVLRLSRNPSVPRAVGEYGAKQNKALRVWAWVPAFAGI